MPINRSGLNKSAEPRWEMNHTDGKPSFLPAVLDKSYLIDITTMADPYRKYIDMRNGEIHDGAEYHRRYLEEVENENKQK